MAWEWVGPTATALVGIVGMASTFWTGKEQRETQFRVIQSQHRADVALEERKEKRQLFARFLGTIGQFLYDYRIRDTLSKAMERRDSDVVELLDDRLSSDPTLAKKLEDMHPGITADIKAMESLKKALGKEIAEKSKSQLMESLQKEAKNFGMERLDDPDSMVSLRDIKVLCSEVELIASDSVGDLARTTTRRIIDYSSPSSNLSDADINAVVKSLHVAMKKELYSDSDKN